MNTTEIVRIFRAINNKVSCPRCGARYSFEQIKIIKIEEGVCFVSLNCGQHPPMIASVVMNKFGEEQIKDYKEQINSDDLIVSYEKLKEVKSITDLFRKNRRS